MNKKSGFDKSRRGFIKKLAFVPPAILTLSSLPAMASSGSGYTYNKDGSGGWDSSYSSGGSYDSGGSYSKDGGSYGGGGSSW